MRNISIYPKNIMEYPNNVLEVLEPLVNKYGVTDVVALLADICNEKSDRESNEYHKKFWREDADKLNDLANELIN